jgi:uncharacterized protein (DUF2461 family)
LYAQLSSRGLYAGTGYYRMSPDQLQRYRQAVAEDGTGSRLAKEVGLARERGLTVEGGGLRTAPRGYPKDHPRIELLRMTSVIVGRAWPAADGISRGAALGGVTETWRSAQAVTSWLDEHVGRAVG